MNQLKLTLTRDPRVKTPIKKASAEAMDKIPIVGGTKTSSSTQKEVRSPQFRKNPTITQIFEPNKSPLPAIPKLKSDTDAKISGRKRPLSQTEKYSRQEEKSQSHPANQTLSQFDKPPPPLIKVPSNSSTSNDPCTGSRADSGGSRANSGSSPLKPCKTSIFPSTSLKVDTSLKRVGTSSSKGGSDLLTADSLLLKNASVLLKIGSNPKTNSSIIQSLIDPVPLKIDCSFLKSGLLPQKTNAATSSVPSKASKERSVMDPLVSSKASKERPLVPSKECPLAPSKASKEHYLLPPKAKKAKTAPLLPISRVKTIMKTNIQSSQTGMIGQDSVLVITKAAVSFEGGCYFNILRNLFFK